jgi:hypothetical protein
MATTTPIDVERYLLEGESGEADIFGLKKIEARNVPTKPPLEEALRSHYSKLTGQPAGTELTPPVPLDPATVQAGKTTLQKGRELLPSVSMPNVNVPNILSRIGEGANDAISPGSSKLVQPLGLQPTPSSGEPFSIYSTLQKHAGFVRDIAEAGGKTLAGMGAFAFGAATAASDILNTQLARIAGGGPLAGGPESPTHYRDIFQRMDKTIHDLTPEPRSDIAKNVNRAVGTVTGFMKDIAELPAKGLTSAGILNEDTAKVLSFATELYLFYKLDRGIREAAPELRAKIANFKERFSKGKTDADATGAAEDLANAASKNPQLDRAIDEARGKFINEADREAGRPPRELQPEGPAPGGGAAIDPALEQYESALRSKTEQLRTERPDLFGPESNIEALKTELNKIPKPQSRGTHPVNTMEVADAVLGRQEAPIPTPTPTADRPLAPEDVGRQETTVPPTELIRPTVGGDTTTFRTEDLPPAAAITPEVAATVAPETVPAPVSPEIPTVAAALPASPNLADPRARAFLNDGKLAELKGLAREAANGSNILKGLMDLGFPREEIRGIAEQLRKVRAKKAGTETLQQVADKPAIQTAATEAVLDTAPVGTEVEIPAPSESVVDTSPAIEKPKRKRRVVKAPETTTSETRVIAEEEIQLQQGDSVGFVEISNIAGLNESARSTTLPSQYTEPIRTSIQVRTTGGKPNALFVDTTGMNSRTTLTDIEWQVQSGRTSPDVGQVLRDSLQRQADIAGLPIDRAQEFTGQELMREAIRIAAETGVDLYVKKGKNYELVPKDVVRTDARLNNGDNLAPKPISSETAGAYVESKTSDIGPATVREIMEAIEQGVDISERLPSELIPHYRQMLETDRAGIDTSERRAFIDILDDLNTMIGEQGAIGGNFTREMRMAAQRLQADMHKAGKTVREFLFGARPEDVAQFETYLDRINNPAPPDSTNPRNMRFDPENVIKGDRVVKHRVISKISHLEAPPLWKSEVTALQSARDIKPGGTAWDLKLPIRQHKAAGTEFIYYAYRTAQKNLNAELNTLHVDMQEISRGFSSRSLENIGANGYQRQGADGQRILTYNKVTPKPLTIPERKLQAKFDSVYAALETRINEVREATGREPLPHVDDYQTFARTISLLNRIGIKVDLARDTPAAINSKYIHHKATNFPYVIRKHAFYTAEMNALKILDTYAQAALKDIHMSPFIAKTNELIDTNLPDPVTSKETWSLKDQKPGLYTELRRWTDYLATGTNMDIPATQRIVLQTLNSNIAYATLSGLFRSAGIQLSTLVNTSQALGTSATVQAVFANLADHFTGGKRRQFALESSEILSSRKFIDAYNQAAAAIIGRRPRDFFHAIRVGDFGSVQQALGQPGFKLLELFDMEAAVMSWNAAYKIARNSKMGYSHKDAVHYADDLVVRTQGSTMPGDLSGAQRNALGKLITQFQTFIISDFNFLRNEVLSKGKSGGGGGSNIPPGGVPSGTGSWETGGPRTQTQFIKNVLGLLIKTQLVNELYKLLHIQPPLPDPVEDVRKGMKEDHSLPHLAFDLAVGQVERIPGVGSMRYGRGIAGPASEIARDLARSYRGDPMASNPLEPTATLLGIPYTRQTSKTLRGLKRGENTYDSLMGWYSQEPGRERPERRERRR